ncbi:hypothetical protein EYC80_007509 [Monilinia laxa]|uniref:Uncharacterized protein n=1 Tax=Monilinia laxa TaxID=61186 RepID=A0A5N6JW48_MONLA|nr:hypothetical protein EYC80_007509 [Monilinia laxa]
MVVEEENSCIQNVSLYTPILDNGPTHTSAIFPQKYPPEKIMQKLHHFARIVVYIHNSSSKPPASNRLLPYRSNAD